MCRSLRSSLAAVLLLWSGIASAQPSGGNPFETLDQDRDGKLSREELPGPFRSLFDRIDADRDGSISREEEAAFRRRMAQGRGNPAPLPDSVELEKDIPYAGTDNPRQRL